MAVKTAWSAGDVLTAADLTDTFAAKAADATQGLYLITNQSFTTQAAVSVNSCFSSTYDIYRVIINLTAVNSDGNLYMRLRKSGTDLTSGYYTMVPSITSAGASANMYGNNASLWYLMNYDGGSSAHAYSISLDVQYPKVSGYTTANGTVSFVTSAGAISGGGGGFLSTSSDSYDGFTIGSDAGGSPTVTGNLKVFGYKNS